MSPYGLYVSREGKARQQYMDVADISVTGAPSRYGKQRSRKRRSIRRTMKKRARRTWRTCIR